MTAWRRLALTAGLVLTGTAAAQQPAPAAFPGADGAAVYQRNGNIYLLRFVDPAVTPAGFLEQRLVGGGVDADPSWSKDGRRVVFRTTTGQVRVVNGDGTGRRTVAGASDASQPAWAPGGKKIVYIRTEATGTRDVWVVPAAGGVQRRVTRDGGRDCGNSHPAWSPDGRFLAYLHHLKDVNGLCSGQAGPELVVRRVSDGAVTRLREFDAVDLTGRMWPFAEGRIGWSGGIVVVPGRDDCLQLWAGYDPTTGSTSVVGSQYRCEGGNFWRSVVPAPSGTLTGTFTIAGGGAGLFVGSRQVLTAPYGSWPGGVDVDVQPLPG